MADSTTNITQIEASQSQKEVTANGLFDAASVAMIGARRAEACSGLVWGYYGGRWGGSSVANGTLTLNPSDTNYIVLDRATGEVLLDTASSSDDLWSFPEAFARLYEVETGASSVTSYLDHRAGPYGVFDLSAGIGEIAADDDDIIQRKSGAWTNRTVTQYAADLQGTGLEDGAVGFRNIPANSQSSNYTTDAEDAGKVLIHPIGAGSGDTFTIDSDDNVPYPVGTAITFVNMDSNVLSIAIGSDTLRLAGPGTTGTRQLAQYGCATALKVDSTVWLISGSGLS